MKKTSEKADANVAEPFVLTSPFRFLFEALSQVPGLRILFGVVAVFAILAIARSWSLDRGWTIIGGVAVIFFAFLLTILAGISGSRRSPFRHQAMVIMWFVVVLFMVQGTLMTFCVFFKWPLSIATLPLLPNPSIAAQTDAVRRAIAAVEARSDGLDSIASNFERDVKLLFEWNWTKEHPLPLDDGPWKAEQMLTTVIESYRSMISPNDYRNVLALRNSIREARADIGKGIVDPNDGHIFGEADIAAEFVYSRSEYCPQIERALADWHELHSTVAEYCQVVLQYCSRDEDAEEVKRIYSEVERAFTRRKATDDQPPELLQLIRQTQVEVVKLADMVD